MSLNKLTSAVNKKPWMNINANNIEATVVGGETVLANSLQSLSLKIGDINYASSKGTSGQVLTATDGIGGTAFLDPEITPVNPTYTGSVASYILPVSVTNELTETALMTPLMSQINGGQNMIDMMNYSVGASYKFKVSGYWATTDPLGITADIKFGYALGGSPISITTVAFSVSPDNGFFESTITASVVAVNGTLVTWQGLAKHEFSSAGGGGSLRKIETVIGAATSLVSDKEPTMTILPATGVNFFKAYTMEASRLYVPV